MNFSISYRFRFQILITVICPYNGLHNFHVSPMFISEYFQHHLGPGKLLFYSSLQERCNCRVVLQGKIYMEITIIPPPIIEVLTGFVLFSLTTWVQYYNLKIWFSSRNNDEGIHCNLGSYMLWERNPQDYGYESRENNESLWLDYVQMTGYCFWNITDIRIVRQTDLLCLWEF